MNTETTENLLILKSKRSDLISLKKEALRGGCDCGEYDYELQNIQQDINYIEFTGEEYFPNITPYALEIIKLDTVVNPYVFKSSSYLLEDFVETIECNSSVQFPIYLTSVINQENREVNIINSGTAAVNIIADTGEEIGNDEDAAQLRQLDVGDSVTLKSNGISTWRIS